MKKAINSTNENHVIKKEAKNNLTMEKNDIKNKKVKKAKKAIKELLKKAMMKPKTSSGKNRQRK